MDTTRYAQDARDIEEGARAEIEASDPRFDPDGTPVAPSVAADRQREADNQAITLVSFLLAQRIEAARDALRAEGAPRQSVHRDELAVLASAKGVVDGLHRV